MRQKTILSSLGEPEPLHTMKKGISSEDESKETAPNNAAGQFDNTDNENEEQKEISNEKEELSGNLNNMGIEIDNADHSLHDDKVRGNINPGGNVTAVLVYAAGSIDDEDKCMGHQDQDGINPSIIILIFLYEGT